jgi:hypothetical protein
MWVNNMATHIRQTLIKSGCLLLLLTACGGKDRHYQDTQLLERPPTLAIDRRASEGPLIEPDNSVIAKKSTEEGLGSDVSIIESKPVQITLKKSLGESWNLVERALKQGHIRVVDHEQEKGLYYLYYKPKNLLENATALFGKSADDERHEANVLVTLTAVDAETKIAATPINIAAQNNDEDSVNSDLDALLWDLYEILHDDLKEE